jgi:hypothetical protein
MTKSRHILRPRKYFTPAEDELLRQRYPHEITDKIAADMGRPVSSIHGHASRLGLKKTAAAMLECLRESGRRGSRHPNSIAQRIQPGNVPLNKGTRRPGYFAGRMRDTMFKKGQAPRNWLPIGTVVMNCDGYLQRKMREPGGGFRGGQCWALEHARIWKEAHGPIPAGHIVVFKDRDKRNVKLDNLELITLAENMRRNNIHVRRPPELKSAIYALIHLKRSMTMREKREKRHAGEKQAQRSA